MKQKTILLITGAVLVLGLLVSIYVLFMSPLRNQSAQSIDSFEECKEAGYPIMESYPERCAVPGGETFTRDIENEFEIQNETRIESPRPLSNEEHAGGVRDDEGRGHQWEELLYPKGTVDEEGNMTPIESSGGARP